jgi:hypothetical protein
MAKLKIKHKQSNVFTGPSVAGAAGYGGGAARAANVIVDDGYPNAGNSLLLSTIGVVGGEQGLGAPANTTGNSNVILCIANVVYDGNVSNAVAFSDGYIIRQKGKHKFLVGSAGNASYQQVCLLSNVADGNTANLPAATATLGTMAIQGVDAGSANIAVYAITDKHVWGFPTNYANANSQGNLQTATQYYGSYGNANATVQPGPGSAGAGLYAIIDIANNA